MEGPEITQAEKRSAITINIQSWMTPVIGILMLVTGLLGGYYGRPLVSSSDEAAAVPQSIVPAQGENAAASKEELTTYLTSQARHFTGDPNAPVAVIEFGDFQ